MRAAQHQSDMRASNMYVNLSNAWFAWRLSINIKLRARVTMAVSLPLHAFVQQRCNSKSISLETVRTRVRGHIIGHARNNVCRSISVMHGYYKWPITCTRIRSSTDANGTSRCEQLDTGC